MILQLLNGDLLQPPEKITTVDDARVWLASVEIFPSPRHIVFTRLTDREVGETYLVVYAPPSLYIPDPFTFPESQYNFSNSSWMSDCVNESILTYLAADERYVPTLLAYPALWRNSHPLITARIIELLPDLYSHKLRPNCLDLVWGNVWANSNPDIVDHLLTKYYRDSMCFGLRTMIENTNPKMVDWCLQHLFEEPDDMPWHLMYTRVTNLLPNATTPETVRDLWEKWKKIPPAAFRQLPFNGRSAEYVQLFRRDMISSELYKFVKYSDVTDEDLALECAQAWGKKTQLCLACLKCPCEKVISYLLDEVCNNEMTIDQLGENPTDRAVDVLLARLTGKEYTTDRVLYLLRHNKNPRAVQFCTERLATDGRDLFDIIHHLGEKHFGNGYVGLHHMTPALASWICTQPSFFQRVEALDDSGLRKKWLWNVIIALSRGNDCHIYFV